MELYTDRFHGPSCSENLFCNRSAKVCRRNNSVAQRVNGDVPRAVKTTRSSSFHHNRSVADFCFGCKNPNPLYYPPNTGHRPELGTQIWCLASGSYVLRSSNTACAIIKILLEKCLLNAIGRVRNQTVMAVQTTSRTLKYNWNHTLVVIVLFCQQYCHIETTHLNGYSAVWTTHRATSKRSGRRNTDTQTHACRQNNSSG